MNRALRNLRTFAALAVVPFVTGSQCASVDTEVALKPMTVVVGHDEKIGGIDRAPNADESRNFGLILLDQNSPKKSRIICETVSREFAALPRYKSNEVVVVLEEASRYHTYTVPILPVYWVDRRNEQLIATTQLSETGNCEELVACYDYNRAHYNIGKLKAGIKDADNDATPDEYSDTREFELPALVTYRYSEDRVFVWDISELADEDISASVIRWHSMLHHPTMWTDEGDGRSLSDRLASFLTSTGKHLLIPLSAVLSTASAKDTSDSPQPGCSSVLLHLDK